MSSVVTVGFCSSTRWDLASTAQDQKNCATRRLRSGIRTRIWVGDHLTIVGTAKRLVFAVVEFDERRRCRRSPDACRLNVERLTPIAFLAVLPRA